MLLSYNSYLCNGILLFMLFILACAGYAYSVNSRRPASDPKKKDIHPAAILLAPVTWPLLLLGTIALRIIIRLIVIPILATSNLFLLLFKKLLELVLEQLKGRERLKHIFLRTGLALFILGSLFQIIALLV